MNKDRYHIQEKELQKRRGLCVVELSDLGARIGGNLHMDFSTNLCSETNTAGTGKMFYRYHRKACRVGFGCTK